MPRKVQTRSRNLWANKKPATVQITPSSGSSSPRARFCSLLGKTKAALTLFQLDIDGASLKYIIHLVFQTAGRQFTASRGLIQAGPNRITYAGDIGIPYTDDPEELCRTARRVLREHFLAADMGISGANFGVVESGSLCLVSNEGNIRMSSTLPRIHMVFMGMERVIARLEDHDMLFRLLARGAAAQNMAGYVSYVGGPRRPGEADGPDAFHLVVLDNGRTRILADPRFREMLLCIRCAACLNVCPVYGRIGGHAYGYPYSGPVGAVVTPLLVGINRAKDLCTGETLCGACRHACPVDIDIPRMLLALRTQLAEGDPTWGVKRTGNGERAAFALWSVLAGNRRLYDLAQAVAIAVQGLFPRRGGMIRRLPPPFDGWTRHRDLRPLASESFHRRWKASKGGNR